MKTLNRQGILLIGKNPMLDWAASQGLEMADYHKMFLVDFDDDYTVDQAPTLIAKHAMTMLEIALGEVYRRRDGWPPLTQAGFDEWFEAHVVLFLIDLSDQPLEIL